MLSRALDENPEGTSAFFCEFKNTQAHFLPVFVSLITFSLSV
jgi:hypothetical protein